MDGWLDAVLCHGIKVKWFGHHPRGFIDGLCNNHDKTYHQEHAEAYYLNPNRGNESDRCSMLIRAGAYGEGPRLQEVKR